MKKPAYRLGVGQPDARSSIAVDGHPIAPTSSPEFPFEVGQVGHLQLPGGGGHGDPASRDPADIALDLKAGYFTEEGAKRDYGHDG